MKFEKQNLQTIRIGNMHLGYCDPITSNNIVGFVKQEQRLMPLPIVSKLSDDDFSIIIKTACEKWAKKDSVSASLRSAAYSRFSHSSDWKEIRYLEKADVSSLLYSMAPAIYSIIQLSDKSIPEGSIAMAVKHSFRRALFFPSIELLTVMINKWLFDPQIIELAECCRAAYQRFSCDNAELSLAVFALYSTLIYKWFSYGLDEKEAQGWVQKN